MVRFSGVIVVFVFFCCFFFSLCFPQTESITITTYYPSPYGVYSNLQADKFALGDTDGDGSITAADLPSTSGNMVFKPHMSAPSTWAPGKEGELAYSQGDHMFYYYNGGGWAPQAGGGGAIILIGPINAPNCPAGWTDALGGNGYWFCPMGGSDSSGATLTAGGTCFCAHPGPGWNNEYYFDENVGPSSYQLYVSRLNGGNYARCSICVK